MIERTQAWPEDRLARLEDPARVAEDTEIAALLWSAADTLGDRDREVLDLTLRHNLPPAEIAEVIGMNRNAANQLVHRVKQRLGGAVGARMLWRDGIPSCSLLRAELVAADIEEFNADAVRVIERHTATCDDCDERRRTSLAPAALFSALPIMSVPFLKAKVAHALDAQGVAMQGSNAAAAANGTGVGISRFGRVRRILLGSGTAAAVVIAVLAIGTSGIDEDGRIVVDEAVSEQAPTTARTISSTAAGATTPTTATALAPLPPTTIASPPTTRPRATPRIAPGPTAGTPGPGAAVTTPPVVVVPPIPEVVPTTPPPTSPPPTAPPAPIIRFTMTPLRIGLRYQMLLAPVLRWEVTGAAEVTVFGPGAKGEGLSGSAPVCPGTVEILPGLPATCIAIQGLHTYTLEATNGWAARRQGNGRTRRRLADRRRRGCDGALGFGVGVERSADAQRFVEVVLLHGGLEPVERVVEVVG